MEFEFDPSIDHDADPNYYERSEPLDQHVRRGISPFWFAYLTDCTQCGEYFVLSWPLGVTQVDLHSLVHVECPHCYFDFARPAHKLLCAWAAAGARVGHVRRIETNAIGAGAGS
jgi:hypothetical protein